MTSLPVDYDKVIEITENSREILVFEIDLFCCVFGSQRWKRFERMKSQKFHFDQLGTASHLDAIVLVGIQSRLQITSLRGYPYTTDHSNPLK